MRALTARSIWRIQRTSRGGHERDRDAGLAGAAGAADAVDVGLRALRDVVVDDVADIRDIETAGGDVGRDQDIGLTGAEAAHDAVALGLGEIAVERLGRVAARHRAPRRARRRLILVRQKIIAERWRLRRRGCGSGRRSCGCAAPHSRPA